MSNDTEFQDAIKERFAQLPKIVQEAIVSADISQHLRELAKKHNLHLDQWSGLENEVQLTLLGVQPSDDLAKNIQSELGVTAEVATGLADDISKIVFEPIRQELERTLQHPDAVAKATSGVEDMRTSILADASENPISAPVVPPPTAVPADTTPITPAASAVTPATPPAPAPTTKVERAPVTPPSYVSSPSHERKTIEGDPYREQLE